MEVTFPFVSQYSTTVVPGDEHVAMINIQGIAQVKYVYLQSTIHTELNMRPYSASSQTQLLLIAS